MKNSFLTCAAFLLIIEGLAPEGFGQEKSPDAIYIIFDASGSMWQQLPDKSYKIGVAKQVLQDFVAGDFKGYELAFRAYGHRKQGDCLDSELVVPFAAPDKVVPQLRDFMKDIHPKGKTPISYSLREALKDFGDRGGEILLISDGIETCDDDPCDLVRRWREKEVKVRVHVVGLGLDEKSRDAMKCISDAAGTEYHDAASAAQLADGLKKIQKETTMATLKLEGVDASRNPLRIHGTLSQNGRERFKVASHARNLVEPGEYVLIAGVQTRNGNLYKPVTKNVQIAQTGETTVKVEVQLPPSVRAKFMDRGEEQPGSLIHAYQDGEEVFSFRWKDEVYVNEGTYEFRAKPNPENELAVTESFSAGDHKQIVFEMIHTVKVTVKMVASGSGIWFRENYELWQNGEKKYTVHVRSGARVIPGTYDLHLPNKITPYIKPGLIVTDEDEPHFEITVPVGHVTVIYQKADGTRDMDDRCFIGRGPKSSGRFRRSGKKHPLTPGTYNVTGWKQKGDYDRVVFAIDEGEEKEIILRAKR